MPKNSVTDPITDHEIAFAHLLLSGTMNDREAAEAAGLNPATAAYTKSKKRVREYMNHHRAAVSQKLVDQEVEGLRRLNLGRDQVLGRLWELANLSPVTTKGTVSGQIKAIGMLAAIVGWLPHRHDQLSAQEEPPSQVIKPQIYVSEWMREEQQDSFGAKENVTAVEAGPASASIPEPAAAPAKSAPPVKPTHGGAGPDGVSCVPNAIGPNLNSYSKLSRPVGLPGPPGNRRYGRGR